MYFTSYSLEYQVLAVMVKHKVLARLCHATTATASSSFKVSIRLADKLKVWVVKLLIMNTFAIEDCYSPMLLTAEVTVMSNSQPITQSRHMLRSQQEEEQQLLRIHCY